MALQNFAEAEQILNQACQNDPDNSVHWLNRAACLRSLKHNNAAQRVLRQALLRHPENADLKLAYGQVLAELSRERAAVKLLLNDAKPDQIVSTQYLNTAQFLGMGIRPVPLPLHGTGLSSHSRSPTLADRQRDHPMGRRLRIGYLLPISAITRWGASCGRSCKPTTAAGLN